MHRLSVDIETYSDQDIKKTGAYKYALSPAFDILLIAYALDDGPVQCIDLTDAGTAIDEMMLEEFFELMYDEDNILSAYNASFEYFCFKTWMTRRGMKPIPIDRYQCTMVHGLYCGYTAGLAVTGEVLGLPQDKKKMSVGGALIRKFCVPQKPTKKDPGRTRIYPKDEPEKWELFKSYCINDVEAEREIERRLSIWPMPGFEQKQWQLDVIGNEMGVGVDRDLVDGALELNRQNSEALLEEARQITGLTNPNSVKQLIDWLEEDGTETETLRKADVIDLLGNDALPDTQRRVLEIRQQLGKTSCKKYNAIKACTCADDRIRGVMQYYAANRSGRFGGRLVQLQNLPQNHLSDLAWARQMAIEADADALKMMYGESVPDTLSQLIRTAFVPPKGKSYVIADFSAIEARVIAYLAGEKWTLDTFREGGDIYCATASQMFGVPVGKKGPNAELRQKGKVATLALGYAGGVGALIAMNALKMGLTEEELPGIKDAWRKANPHIVSYWYEVGDAAMNVILTREPQYLKHGITFRYESDHETGQEFMTIELPSGRKLFYAHPSVDDDPHFPGKKTIFYWGKNQSSTKGSKAWERISSHGGKLVENIVQAVARDLLCNVLNHMYAEGYTPVFHVHDEVIVEASTEWKDEVLEMMLDYMAQPPSWARGLPLKGAGFTSEFYMKD